MPILFAFALQLGPALAAEEKKAGPQAGRYAISIAIEGLYFLDTATGELWLQSGLGKWKRIDSPVSRVPKSKEPEPTATDKTTATLKLPKDGVTMPMIQREKRPVPGSSERLFVHLGDITGAQVFVEIIDADGEFLVERSSLKNDEFLKFELDGKTVFLQVEGMVNNLFGDDICKVRLTHKKPKPKPKPKPEEEPTEKAESP